MNGHLIIGIIVSIFGAISNVQSAAVSDFGCSFPFSSAADLPNWFPLVWNADGIVYPEETSKRVSSEESEWAIRVPNGKSITFGCTDLSLKNVLKNFLIKELTFTCNRKLLKSSFGPASAFSKLGCTEMTKENIDVTGRCYNDNSNIQIGFNSVTRDFPLINLCHNEDDANTLMAQHVIHGGALNPAEVSNRRPSFKSAQFYKDFPVSTAYTQTSQLHVFTDLFGPELANKYIDSSESFFFARGHLAPDGDFVHIYEQNATYYYANVIPQWQSINNGNWKAMEVAIREYATENKVNLNVWTGGHGVLKLDDEDGNPKEIYLGKDYQLPVPELAWKIVEDPTRSAAVAIIMQNNPHLETVSDAAILCPNICDQLSWVTWDTSRISKGFTYCCKVSEANKVIPQAPKLKSDKILN